MARRGLSFLSSFFKKEQLLHSNYLVKNYLGEGGFGKVFECIKMDTKETVAVKVLQHNDPVYNELNLLNSFKDKKLDRFNIVRFIESFQTKENKTALAFEKLDLTLVEYLSYNRNFPLHDVRNVVQQMATALEALKENKVIHSDIKLNNIMLMDRREQPLSAKLIDFGTAFQVWEAIQGRVHQTLRYRAPEIILGLPFSESIDMWSLGVVMGHMTLGHALFPGDDEYHTLRYIVELLGAPPERLLNTGMYTDTYFVKRPSGQWKLKTALEYWGAHKYFIDTRNYRFRNLDDFKAVPPPKLIAVKPEEKETCIDLLKAMLKVDPDQRITPREVLAHPFITMGSAHCHSLNLRTEPGPSKTVEAGTTQAAEPRRSQADEKKKKTKTNTYTSGCRTRSTPSFPVFMVRPSPPERFLVFDKDSRKQREACPSDRPKDTSDKCPESCNREQKDKDLTGRTPGDTEPKEEEEKKEKEKEKKNGFERVCSWMKRRFCWCSSVSEDKN
ncbi:homeodomain-interacting protein kinase 1-like [Toxotes jaculatrix]|uniref:homeodomain-interacting protein kinase 1-like n=1 Tax=Toxotes jaculatrix TaxID=941984 RepID=UPI001B3AF9C4|nr:homeodomain-interacting protein kinase 1-like [Toxotes jaculatrix]